MTVATGEYPFLQHLVFERAAIVLGDGQEYLVDSRLSPIARELGLAGSDALLERVRLTRDRPLEDRVVEAMTTNETLWFRDVHPFNALRHTVLPDLRSRRAEVKRLSVWSAASSSGQELYSIIMLIGESHPDLLDWYLQMHGTDLSSEMVRRAREGRYSTLEINRGLPAALMVRYFDHAGTHYILREDIRRRAEFKQMNLAEPWPAMARYDLIMVRNVLIYFDVPTRKRILEAAAQVLAPDGYLFIGSSETMVGVTDIFEQQTADGATFYRLKGSR